MKVKDLIEFLHLQPQDIEVGIAMYSEYQILNFDEIKVVEHCQPRPDGWIQWKRPDMPTQFYLMFPGN